MQGNCCRLRQTLPSITHDTGPKITPSRRTQPEKNETFVVAVWSRAAEQAACRVGDHEAAREAARLCCEQRVRLATVSSQLRGVRQRVQAVGSARVCARERATRERSGSQSSSVCVCGRGAIARVLRPTQWSSIGGCCSRPRTNAKSIGENARVPWANALLG